MSRRHFKAGCFVLEGLNICAAVIYFNYLFFVLRQEFGFGNRENLFVAALNGFIYVFASWFGGRFGQRRGYFTALQWGYWIMLVALVAGAMWRTVPAQLVVMVVWTLGVCFTWPALEALASEYENRTGLARMIGIYNVVWSAGAALAYFVGGALLDLLGRATIFWLPVALYLAQSVLAFYLSRGHDRLLAEGALKPPPDGVTTLTPVPAEARTFLRLAWVANPFAYVAMNTLFPLLPELAARFGLSTASAGFAGSVWMFARLLAFIHLWRWTAWHYRFGWLAAAYALLIAGFAAMLLAPNLAVLVLAQLVFGWAVGLIYYSSLFYSMDVGETKGEHGGLHEALIGVGVCAGPAVGALSHQLVPNTARAEVLAVTALLVLGAPVLLALRRRAK